MKQNLHVFVSSSIFFLDSTYISLKPLQVFLRLNDPNRKRTTELACTKSQTWTSDCVGDKRVNFTSMFRFIHLSGETSNVASVGRRAEGRKTNSSLRSLREDKDKSLFYLCHLYFTRRRKPVSFPNTTRRSFVWTFLTFLGWKQGGSCHSVPPLRSASAGRREKIRNCAATLKP